jgi:hypothetical protein
MLLSKQKKGEPKSGPLRCSARPHGGASNASSKSMPQLAFLRGLELNVH